MTPRRIERHPPPYPREMGVFYQNIRQSGQNTFRVLRPIAAYDNKTVLVLDGQTEVNEAAKLFVSRAGERSCPAAGQNLHLHPQYFVTTNRLPDCTDKQSSLYGVLPQRDLGDAPTEGIFETYEREF